MDMWCFHERKTDMRMIRWMCAGFPERKTDEDDQVDVWCFSERKTEMRMIRWMCGVSLKERQPSRELRR